jgi:hypothetical protein
VGRTVRKWRAKEPQEATSNSSKKRSSQDAGLAKEADEELADTAASPLKKQQRVETNPDQNQEGSVNPQLNLDAEPDDSSQVVPPPPPAYISPSEQRKLNKRASSGGSGKEDDENLAKAGSLEECRRQQ